MGMIIFIERGMENSLQGKSFHCQGQIDFFFLTSHQLIKIMPHFNIVLCTSRGVLIWFFLSFFRNLRLTCFWLQMCWLTLSWAAKYKAVWMKCELLSSSEGV